MKKAVLMLILATVFVACSSVKRSQKELNRGNYVEAMNLAIKKLQKDKTNKRSKDLIPILEDAFAKYTEESLNRIAFLERENSPVSKREIFNLYSRLDQIQNSIRPLLPLYRFGGEAQFQMNDYSHHLIEAKGEYATFLYDRAQSLMATGDKMQYRNAHKTLNELQKLSPHFRDTDQLLREAHYNGTDYVFVELKNATNLIIPQRLERDLLDFNTYRLDDFWTEYHSINRRDIDYDFEVLLQFRDIMISPERVHEREVRLEREILDGYTYEIDRNGNYGLDSQGTRKRIDRYVVVKGTLYETTQTKAIAVNGMVDYYDVKRRQLMNSHPLETEFIFENIFATFKGDERVLNSDERRLLRNRPVPFPSNEQMLFDASSEIKNRLSAILKRNKFR
jgi:hypothetical protein